MPTIIIQGQLKQNVFTPPAAQVSGSVNLTTIQRSDVKTTKAAAAFKWGSLPSPSPIPAVTRTIALYRMGSYRYDFYDRIIIRPSNVNVGNLVADQQYNIEVWNGYTVPRTLTDMQVTGGEGISLAGPVPPAVWAGLQTQTYSITITTNGPAEIAGIFKFIWDSGPRDTGYLTVTGARIVSLPYQFQASATEVLEWKTNVIISNNAKEQRVRVRKAPRQTYNVNYPLPNTEMARAENLIFGWMARRWAVVSWNEASQIPTLIAGSTNLAVNPANADYRIGSSVMIWESPRKNTVGQIATMDGGAIQLLRPTAETYNNPFVVPVRIGRNLNGVTRNTKGFNGSLDIQYDIIDNIAFAPAAPAQFLGYDIYFDPSLFSEQNEVADNMQQRIDTVDYGNGLMQAFSPWAVPQIQRSYIKIAQGLTEIWALKMWLHRRAGKLRPFWTPTFEHNLRINQTGVLTGGFTAYADDYKAFASGRKHLAIGLRDGTWLIRTILGATESDDNVTLSLDTALNINANTISVICFLGLKRLNTDRVELQWGNNCTVSMNVPILELSQ